MCRSKPPIALLAQAFADGCDAVRASDSPRAVDKALGRPRSPLLILAAGRGSRLGQPKALVCVDGRPWVEHQLEHYARSGGKRVCLVLGHGAERHYQALPWLGARPPFAPSLHVSVALNARPERGMRASLDVGLSHLREVDSLFVLPVDCPPSAEAWERLEGDTAITFVPWHKSRGGHPIRLGRALLSQLRATSGGDKVAPLREALNHPSVRRVELEDPSVIANLNTVEDWRAHFGRRAAVGEPSGSPPLLHHRTGPSR